MSYLMRVLEGRHQIRLIVTRRYLMNTANYKPALFNNSLTANIQGKICNCLGCNELADTEITLKIAEKSLNILVCKNCKPKFET